MKELLLQIYFWGMPLAALAFWLHAHLYNARASRRPPPACTRADTYQTPQATALLLAITWPAACLVVLLEWLSGVADFTGRRIAGNRGHDSDGWA